MTDRELLELAAKAAGYTVRTDLTYDRGAVINDGVIWNPLTDDGDALRLAVKLDILSRHNNEKLNALIQDEQRHNLRDAATRRAIVRAATEIVKGVK